MRSMLLIVALISVASAAHAEEARESRYGPRPDRRTAALSATTGYAGPILGWAGKQAPAAAPPVLAAQPMREPWRQLGARPSIAPAPQAQQQPMSEPWRNLGVRPQSPAPQPQQQAMAAQRSPAPQTIYDIAPMPPAQVAPSRAASNPQPSQAMAPSMARTYSVGRQYGLQPDALPPLQPNGMVFIAPSEEAPRLKDEEPRHGSAEWLAAGARGDEGADRDNAKDGDL